MIKRIIYMLVLAVAAAACSQSNFEPGEAAAPGAPGVYFAPTDGNTFMLYAGTTTNTVPLTLGRSDSRGDLRVDLEVAYADAALEMPASAFFADGESTAEITVGFKNAPEPRRRYRFGLTIPAALTRPYDTDPAGSTTLEASVVIVETSQADCTFWEFAQITGGNFSMEMVTVSDTEFLFPDFMNSGHAVTIRVDPSDNEISIDSDMGEYVPEYQDYWFYEPLYPGGDAAISYIYDSYVYYPGYSYYYDDADGRGIALSMYVYFADGTQGYDYFYINFPE